MSHWYASVHNNHESTFLSIKFSYTNGHEYRFSCARVTIVTSGNALCNRLWRHGQNTSKASEARVDAWRSLFSPLMGSLCRARTECMHWRGDFLCAHEGVTLEFISFEATRKMDTKMTLSWVHERFATQAYTLFMLHVICSIRKLPSSPNTHHRRKVHRN